MRTVRESPEFDTQSHAAELIIWLQDNNFGDPQLVYTGKAYIVVWVEGDLIPTGGE